MITDMTVGIRRVHHIGLVVHNLDEVIALYRDTFGLPLAAVEDVPDQGVRVAVLPIGETQIELLQPIDPTTGVAAFLEKRGEGIHHLCFQVDNIQAALDTLAAQGRRLVDTQPRSGAHGHKVAFLHPKSTHGVLIELCEAEETP